MVRIVCNAHALVMEAENAITTIYTGLHIRCPRTGIRVIYACAQTRSKIKFEKADVVTMPTPYSIDLRWRVVWLVHGFASHEIADLFCGEKGASSNTHAHTNLPRACGQWLCKPV